MIKTNIKMRVDPKQSKKVQDICFKNGITEGLDKIDIIDKNHFLFIFSDRIGFDYISEDDFFSVYPPKEVDADLFIRTNGTCIENPNEHLDRLDDTFKEREPIIEDRMKQFIEDVKKENDPFLDFYKLVKEKNNKEDRELQYDPWNVAKGGYMLDDIVDEAIKEVSKEDSHNSHYKAQKIDTIARCKANMSLEQQKAICIFNIDKYVHREKGQNLSDIQKVRYYLDWLEEIEIKLKDKE